MNKGVWQATVRRVAKSWIRLKHECTDFKKSRQGVHAVLQEAKVYLHKVLQTINLSLKPGTSSVLSHDPKTPWFILVTSEEGERSPEGYVSQVSSPLKHLTVSQLSQLGPAPSFWKCNPFSQK